MRAKFIYESIKHLTPKSEKELRQTIRNMSDRDVYNSWVTTAYNWKKEKIFVDELERRNATIFLKIIYDYYKGTHLYHKTIDTQSNFSFNEFNESIKHLTGRSYDEVFKNMSDEEVYTMWLDSLPYWETEKKFVEELKKRKAFSYLQDIRLYYNEAATRKRNGKAINIDESIRHLKPRSEEELSNLLKDYSDDYLYNRWIDANPGDDEDLYYQELKRRDVKWAVDHIEGYYRQRGYSPYNTKDMHH
jgi:hypothetical protein